MDPVAVLFVLLVAKSAGSNECFKHQEIPCENLRSSKGFTYTLPPVPCSGDCEQGWYYQNGTFLVDPNDSRRRLATVAEVTSQSLTLRVCANLNWELKCDKCNCVINYTVTDLIPKPRNYTLWDEQDGNAGLPAWGIALIAIGVVGAGAFIAILFRRLWERDGVV